ncbi:MAG TPA: hypothetical protein VK465_14410 [Fibrobacteria bacterium]|nr:hypothetical protein [Fibrobacteria bacterium]
MVKQGIASVSSMSALLLLAGVVSAFDSAPAAASGKSPVTEARPSVSAPAFPPADAGPPAGPVQGADRQAPDRSFAGSAREDRESLGDAVITQNFLRVFLNRPAAVTVHNVQGRQIFQLESSRPMESLPLAGVPTGFLYLTLRAGSLELTKKLVYSGK